MRREGEGQIDRGAMLAELRDTLAKIMGSIPREYDASEPEAVLDFNSRGGNKVREFRHILQMCTSQIVVLKRVSVMKIAYILDMYVAALEHENPLGAYILARSQLELHAFIESLSVKLVELLNGEAGNWKIRGTEFYNHLIRARFGTSRKELVKVMQQRGRTAREVEPERAGSMIRQLSERAAFSDRMDYYNVLCDFVHPNASSQNIMADSFKISAVSGFANVRMVTPKPGPVQSFEFPSANAFRHAFEFTAEKTLLSARDAAELVAALPDICFREEECVAMTGTPIGMPRNEVESRALREKVETEEENVARAKSVGRNDPCWCGSGQKAKKCHLR